MLLDAISAAGITPVFDTVVAHHVTHRYPNPEQAPNAQLAIVGHVIGDGVEALVVTVNGSTVRADGSTYHMTLSLADGHKPAESNAVIASHPVTPIDPISFDSIAF